MSKKVKDYTQREVGWLVTKSYLDSPIESTSRVGWGQLRVHATETDSSFGRYGQSTVFMDKSLTEHMIKEDTGVRWRSFDDDDIPCYDGLVTIHWLLGDNEEHSDLAYNIDRFNYHDAGAVHVYYSVNDIVSCARKLERPDWESYAIKHRASYVADDPGRWIEIYA